MSDELKPCPFCGCEMEVVTVGRDWWRIKPIDGHSDECPFDAEHEWDCSQSDPDWKVMHINDWNTRHVSASKISNNTKEAHLRVNELEDKLREIAHIQINTQGNATDLHVEMYGQGVKIFELLNK